MLSTAKISELRLHNRNTTINFPLCSRPSLTVLRYRFNHLFFSTSSSNFGFTAASLRVSEGGKSSSGRADDSKPRKYPWDDEDDERRKNSSLESPGPRPIAPSPPWLQRWSAPTPSSEPRALTLEKNRTRNQGNGEKAGTLERPSGGNGSIERIVHRLRNLGLEKDVEGGVFGEGIEGDGDARLGDLLERSWNRPDSQNAAGYDEGGLPWERDDVQFVIEEEVDNGKLKKRRVKAPTLAELTIEDFELRRLRTAGMTLRERMTIPKAGVTQAIVEKIHDVWKKSELVRLKFHETLAHDMRTAHEIVERRTGGLVIWRAGSVMVVYRGSAYERPLKSQPLDRESASTEGNAPFVPDISQASKTTGGNGDSSMSASDRRNEPSSLNAQSAEITEEEEAEYNRLLDGVGPRFLDWWGTGFLPVDADLLPQNIPGYRAPFRLLPTGMRSRLTNMELTSLRKLARKLPCHFALDIIMAWQQQ